MIWRVIFFTEVAIAIAGIPIAFFHGLGWAMIAVGAYLGYFTWSKFGIAEAGIELKKLVPWLTRSGSFEEIPSGKVVNSELDRLQQELEEIGFENLGDFRSGLPKPSARRILLHRRHQIWAELQPRFWKRGRAFFYSFFLDGTVFQYSNRRKKLLENNPAKIVFRAFKQESLLQIFKTIQQDSIHFSLTYPAAISMDQIPIRTAKEFIRLLDYISIRRKLHDSCFALSKLTAEMLSAWRIPPEAAKEIIAIADMEKDLPQYWGSPGTPERTSPPLSPECQEIINSRDISKLPDFPYSPNAYKNGIIVKQSGMCDCCGQKVAYLYFGGIYSTHTVTNLCPWCIADGVAALRYSGNFNDFEVPVSDEIAEAILNRTPTIPGWQVVPWEICCNDAMLYLEAIGTKKALEKYRGNAAFEDEIHDFEPFPEFDQLKAELPDKGQSSLLIQVFQCRHCGKYKLNFDAD